MFTPDNVSTPAPIPVFVRLLAPLMTQAIVIPPVLSILMIFSVALLSTRVIPALPLLRVRSPALLLRKMVFATLFTLAPYRRN